MSQHDTITGTVVGVRGYGTLVVLYVDAGEGRVIPDGTPALSAAAGR
jgi:hypothetical protein